MSAPADVAARIWARDDSLWAKGEDRPSERLGWLSLPEDMVGHGDGLEELARQVTDRGYETVALLGMGGSSLAPELFASALGRPDYPGLVVFDSTHPDQIAALADGLHLPRTLFVVASKSGTTVETLALYRYFRSLVPQGDHFVAITDRSTPLERLARKEGFRAVFINPSDIGGRYSALSLFGLVPAALVGADLWDLLESAARAAAGSLDADSVAVGMGCALARSVAAGRDKLTIRTTPALSSFADWLEQLLAESTGKQGTGIIPIVGEPPLARYGPDRSFATIGLPEDATAQPDIERPSAGATTLGGEIFLWEFATAVAGAGMGINPFDQPDVEAAKRAARTALEGQIVWQDEDPDRLLEGIEPPEYAGILVFAPSSPENRDVVDRARLRLASEHGVATVAAFGPRYLHSSGQLHKGGPKRLRALVVLADPHRDLAIPGEKHTFAGLLAAQAVGDVQALRAAGQSVATISWERLRTWVA